MLFDIGFIEKIIIKINFILNEFIGCMLVLLSIFYYFNFNWYKLYKFGVYKYIMYFLNFYKYICSLKELFIFF